MTGKQRAYLRSLANDIDPIFQVGKAGIGDAFVHQVDQALEARELIKVRILRNSDEQVRDVCTRLCAATGASPVQCIGSKFVLYRPSEKNKRIFLD